ncbi:calcium-translocating P-type ATPase, PMCA-type [Sedimentibacter sp. zth1]|uniref:calcium-translocating P-type ATPase, PMCA-type n=1 Tax=Sedimentibacter sp. zth1 TaxID=2816908 RepID=UPI001A937D74|nr:calcium-translocating P-type ATPase, PMCA-type [Sedimentibacter sp. zth1]QSX06321.1 calcium-translocating P-type ATPase, PMCA-type [Sedimentibacter sp. zth1]
MSIKKKKSKKFSGLTDKDVKKSRIRYGSNEITKKKNKSFLAQYGESFGDPTIKILLVALFLNVIFFIKNFNWFESIGIAVSIILATLVSTISEYGSQLAFEKLMEDSKKVKCKVWRNYELIEVLSQEIVVGDFVQLQAGDKIPADGILTYGSIDVDQSALNGETEEIHKIAIVDLNETKMNDKNLLNPNMLFSGGIVCDGEGIMLVHAIGDSTFYGTLALELQEEKQDSPLKKRLTQLAKTISRFGYLCAILIFLSSLFNSVVISNDFNIVKIATYIFTPYALIHDVIRAALLAVTIIVVAVPEGLPLMITVVLSSNMKKMVKDNVLVRKLVGIETAGSLNILFTDKTGTLTTGKLKVDTFISGDCTSYRSSYELNKCKKLWRLLYISSIYNNSSQKGIENHKKTIIGGNSTDKAIFEYALRHPVKNLNINKLDIIQFKSENKYATTSISGDLNITLIKGAPEKILPKCTMYYDINGNKSNLNNIFTITTKVRELSNNGIRVLAIATSEKHISQGSQENNFSNLTLVGVVGIRDKIRENAYESIDEATKAGVQIIMITGDGRDTATAIATELGLLEDKNKRVVITSDELNKMENKEVKRIFPSLKVVARALPSDKTRLVKVAQNMGMVVGMTGDGVNDAPALKKADVGFSMGSGTEIAKEASDIIILDNNFLSITKAILYGRTIFKSIRKFIIFQLSINVCAVGISLIGQFMGFDTPITVVQMLWINMVMDTLAGLAFAGESPLPEYMEEKPKKLNEKIINKYMGSQILFAGVFTTLMSIAFLKLPIINNLFRQSSNDRYLLTGFFAFFMFAAVFNSMNARTQRLNLFAHLFKNKAFVVIMTLVLVTQIILIYFGGPVFRAYGLTLKELRICIMFAFLVIPIDLIRKALLRMKATKEEIAKFL